MASLPDSEDISDPAALQQWQANFFEQLMMMCLSKERVSGFYCQNWADEQSDSTPLIDTEGNIHAALAMIGAFESNHWLA